MLWDKNEIAESLPPVHRVEPPSLRAEILDELADHLACAMQRELRRTPDVKAARKAVIARFGNPASVARALWFQAMKEAIMKDRIMLMAVGVLTLAVVVLAAFSWVSLRENQKTNRSLLAALKELRASSSAANPSAVSSDLANATIKVVAGQENGRPIQGFRVELRGNPFRDSQDEWLAQHTNGEGVASFGPINPGNYNMKISDENKKMETIGEGITLYGGRGFEKTVVLPEVQETDVHLELNLPDALKEKPLVVALSFVADNRKASPWYAQHKIGIASDGSMYSFSIEIMDLGNKLLIQKLPAASRFHVPALEYRLEELEVGLPQKENGGDSKSDERGVKYDVVRKTGHESRSGPVFQALPGVENKWKIELPQDLVAQIETEVKAREIQKVLGTVDPGVADRVSGKIVKVYPVVKDCMVLAYIPDWNRGDVDNTAVANNDGGVRTLLDWPRIAGEEGAGEGRRFLLALYSRETTIGVSTAPGAIGIYEILGDWPERTAWKAQPAVAKEPRAKFNFEPGDGWKLFDVTPIIHERGETGRTAYGVELRFAEENRTSQDWSGYAFVSREGEKEPARRPVLLAVDIESSGAAAATSDASITSRAAATTEGAAPSVPTRTR